jgi:hypothetical protein
MGLSPFGGGLAVAYKKPDPLCVEGEVAVETGSRSMLSREFMHTLAIANGQQDITIEQIAKALQVLRREVEWLEGNITVRHNEITLKMGDASIVLKADGSIDIRSTNITVESSGRTTVKASDDLTLKGARVLNN